MVDIANDTNTTATFDGNPNLMATFSSEFETFDDKDWIKVELTAGTTYKFFGGAASAAALGGDSIMRLLDANGVQRAFNDDGPQTHNSSFSFTATTSGTYFVEMSSIAGLPGHYSVAVVRNEAQNQLTGNPDDFSGAGNALIVGDKGDDTILLDGAGPVDALGEQGDDSITGDNGSNFISGGLGNDYIFGDGGDDLIFGDAGEDRIQGSSGDDDIYGGDGADALGGGSYHDTIHGGSGCDMIEGEDGDDVINGGPGQDKLFGDAGNDQFFVDDASDQVFDSTGEGNDTVFSAVSFVLAAGQEIEFLMAESAASATALNLTGNEFGQTITGNNGANFLYGAGGADTLQGLLGNDIYALANGTDAVTDSGGVDTITSTISRSLAGYGTIERLALVGTAAINGTGNSLANALTGNAAANFLKGGIGNDVLNGGSGNDTLDGGTHNDTLLGLAGNDVLVGDLGKDVMTGGLDNDVFRFTAKSHSGVGANADIVKDFDDFGNDRIDVSGLFGPAMSYRHDGAFTAAGQLRINDIAGADVIVEVNTGGSLAADFAVRLTNTTLASMTASDFVL